MSIEHPINIPEKSLSIDKIENLEKIKTPEELLSFMKDNISYGFVGKNDKKIYSPEIEGWGEGKSPEAKLQSLKESLDSGYGTCLEQTELERYWFLKNNYEFKTFFFLMPGKDINQKNPAHSMLAYKKDDKWYWIENTLDERNGIHEFENLEDLTEDVKKVISSNALNNGAAEEDVEKYKLYEHNISVDDCGDLDEFILKITEEN